MKKTEKTTWDETAALLGNNSLKWGNHWSFNFRNDPKRLAFVLSRYKFAAKMGAKGRSVLELGCGEGIGATVLGETASSYTGIDFDQEAILAAERNCLEKERFHFCCEDFMGKTVGCFQTVVSLDVIEHIYLEFEDTYLKTLVNNLSEDGIAIIGTPNVTSAPHASIASQIGHVNLYSQERLKQALSRYFHYVFMFGMNDEIVHTGFSAMSHYIFSVACGKKKDRNESPI